MNAPANFDTRIPQPTVVNHGFQRVMGNAASGYILVSDITDDMPFINGRKLFIEGKVAKLFASLILGNERAYATKVMHGLSQLRSSAGGFESYSNARNAFEHVSLIEDMRISYIILQEGNSQGLSAGIYITDIEIVQHAKGHQPGLYQVQGKDKGWAVDEEVINTIPTRHAAINGLANRLENAAMNIMPDIITEAAYKEEASKVEAEGYTLAYNPPPLYRRGTEWITPEQKASSADFTANLLAKALYDAQVKGQEVKWTVHGDGAILLLNALKKLPPYLPLTKHTLFFAAPAPVMTKLFDEVERHKMALAKDVMKFQSDDWRSITVRTRQQWQVSQRLQAWGEEYSETSARLAYRAKKDVQSVGIRVIGAAGTTFGLCHLGDAISSGVTPSEAISAWIGGIAGAATVGWATWTKADLYRNMAGVYSTDKSINPHMSPHKSSEDFNIQAQQQMSQNGKAKTLFGMVRDMGKNLRSRW
ncbi:hypothetical protein [Hahella ganghwensis]|uniref:hypothetical protein n=1 Tax=Hahella ganghwensis TaxID=286420 RepID=UPI000369C635|nr:hypothetical protein [Hahella ganghwensis]